METKPSDPTAHPTRRIGVLLAGVGGVGEAFVRVLQQRFSTSEVQVNLVAIGDSKGFVASTQQCLDWACVNTILDHKKRGQSLLSSLSGNSIPFVCGFDELVETVHYFHEYQELEDYIVVDCSSSNMIVPALVEARRIGFAVVLANKLPVGGPLKQYYQLTSGAHGRVRYEATVGAGLPVISVLQRIVASRDKIKMIQGGLSGTMTYILSAMNRGEAFSVGLKQVHELRITENDPREDLSGADVARKMVILARELGMKVETSNVEIESLLPQEAFSVPVEEFMRSLHAYDEQFNARLQAARQEGCALVYMGTLYADGRIRIGLEHAPHTSLFATASSTEGVVSISTDWFPEPLILRGTGAGAESTAAAVAGDLAAIVGDFKVSDRT